MTRAVLPADFDCNNSSSKSPHSCIVGTRAPAHANLCSLKRLLAQGFRSLQSGWPAVSSALRKGCRYGQWGAPYLQEYIVQKPCFVQETGHCAAEHSRLPTRFRESQRRQPIRQDSDFAFCEQLHEKFARHRRHAAVSLNNIA